MATYTASVTGNWSDTATWGGSGPPTAADNANINGNIVVTVDVNNAAATRVDIGVTDNTTGIATLQFAANSKLTVSSQIRLGGNTAARDGKLIMGPGATLDGAGALYFNNGYWASTAAQQSERWWYKMTGDVGTLAAGPRQDVQLSYGSFVGTRIFQLYLQNTVGGATSKAIFNHCAWASCRDPIFGAVDSPNTTVITFDNCDFREITIGFNVTLRRAAGGSGNFHMNHCSFVQTGAVMSILPTTSTGFTMTNCAGLNVQVTNASTSGAVTITDCLFASDLSTKAAINPSDAATGNNTFSGNYFLGLAASDNFHPIIPNSSGGSGTHYVTGCVMEAPADNTKDKADLIVGKGSTFPTVIENNLVLWSGEIWVGTHTVSAWAGDLDIKNNTLAVTGGGTGTGGHIFDAEGYPTTGTVNIVNNLYLGNSGIGQTAINGSSLGADQAITYSDFNNFTGIATAYSTSGTLDISSGNTAKTVPGSNDTDDAPNFFDSTRNAARWNQIFGSGTATPEAFAAYFYNGLNGYRGSPNYDQGGTVTPYTVKNAVDWIRYGYSPTSLLLRAAGDPSDSSPDIGAMPVRTKAMVGFF